MRCLSPVSVFGLVLIVVSHTFAAEPQQVDFNRDVRPILSDNCFLCHGPDAANRKAELRLDQRQAATRPASSGESAIVPGNPEQSELIRRITSQDPDQVMPPPSSK